MDHLGLVGAAPGAGLAAQSHRKDELPSTQGDCFSKSSRAFGPELIFPNWLLTHILKAWFDPLAFTCVSG